MGMLAKIRRMHIREKLSVREIPRRTNISRNTVRQWLKSPEISEPKYPQRRTEQRWSSLEQLNEALSER